MNVRGRLIVMVQMSALKVAVLGATIMALAACSQQTRGPYTKFEGMPPDAVVSAPPPAQAPAGGIIAKLDAIVAPLDAYAASARATQPNWSTPLGRN
jgi:hypothetical protein